MVDDVMIVVMILIAVDFDHPSCTAFIIIPQMVYDEILRGFGQFLNYSLIILMLSSMFMLFTYVNYENYSSICQFLIALHVCRVKVMNCTLQITSSSVM